MTFSERWPLLLSLVHAAQVFNLDAHQLAFATRPNLLHLCERDGPVVSRALTYLRLLYPHSA